MATKRQPEALLASGREVIRPAGAAVMGGRPLAQAENRFLVQDVCSEAQHRIPQSAR
jgi:hypothetical protein